MISRRYLVMILIMIILIPVGIWAWLGYSNNLRDDEGESFNGERALTDVIRQTSLGPRIPGTIPHANVVDMISSEVSSAGWHTEIQNSVQMGHPIRNIIASRSDLPPTILIAAHYDSRIYADLDPDQAKRHEPVPGANDGASGVAVLLELARTLPSETVPVWLVFFDAEDNGKIPGWDWILGSRLFVKTIHIKPQAVIVVDMVGDNDLNIYMEGKSDPDLTQEIWQLAQEIGYSQYFIKETKSNIIDDHIPFIEAGIPAVNIIDFDYPYWHTTSDTNDKVSAHSLEIVGTTLWTWIVNYNLAESD